MTIRRPKRGLLWTFLHSIAAKAVVAIAVFVAVPVLLYEQFREADMDKRQLILDSLERQGQVIGEALSPQLNDFDSDALRGIGESLTRLGEANGMNIKLLLRPPEEEDEPGGFYYIAATPQVSNDYLQVERQELVEIGVFDRLRDTCAGNQPMATRYLNPAGEEEVLTSVTPVQTEAGCWAIVTSHDTDEALGAALGRPYWETPQVRVAMVIYALMALLVVSLFIGIARNLRRFARAARTIRVEGANGAETSFSEMNRVPELSGVAHEFDRMVATLHNAADSIRHAAEDNAHAFKTPIATISQSLEPVKKGLPLEHIRARRAVELIENSLGRLDALVAASRRMDEATAELIEAPRERVNLSSFVARTLDGYEEPMRQRGVTVARRLERGRHVMASEDMLENILENLLDNAVDFSPPSGTVEVEMTANGSSVELSVADRGPGVPADRRDQIFERYVSSRPDGRNGQPGEQHFGIGLWLVRRNVEVLGGSVHAEANDPQGLRVVVRLPRA